MINSELRLSAACVTLLLCAPLAAQDKFGARNMYFGGLEAAPKPPAAVKPPQKTTASANNKPPVHHEVAPLPAPKQPGPFVNAARTTLGLRYAILKMTGVDATEVPPSTTFHSGDRIQLRIQANQDGYLYVVSQGSSGGWQVMFPGKATGQGANRVKAGEDHTSIFRFDAKPGVEKLFVVLSRQPERDLDSVIYTLKGGSGAGEGAGKEPVMLASNLTVKDPLVARLRDTYTRDLVLEEVAAPETAERAIYVVNKSTGPDARVVADIKLIHE